MKYEPHKAVLSIYCLTILRIMLWSAFETKPTLLKHARHGSQCDLFITRNGKHDLNCIKACNFKASEVHVMAQHAYLLLTKTKIISDAALKTGNLIHWWNISGIVWCTLFNLFCTIGLAYFSKVVEIKWFQQKLVNRPLYDCFTPLYYCNVGVKPHLRSSNFTEILDLSILLWSLKS